MTEKKIKRFDFAKKPKNPCFIMSVAKGIISFPDLKRRKATITKEGMEELEGKPYLLLINHSSMVDFNLMLKATHPYPVNNVMSLEGFNTYTEPLMRSLGVIGKRKYVSDVNLIRNIKYSLYTLKNIFVLFPEARYSLDGHTSYITPSTAGLIKLMKVPVAVLQIRGNFITNPQWRKKNMFNYVHAHMKKLFDAEETKALSPEQIYSRILEAFEYDDYEWQYKNKIKIVQSDFTACSTSARAVMRRARPTAQAILCGVTNAAKNGGRTNTESCTQRAARQSSAVIFPLGPLGSVNV